MTYTIFTEHKAGSAKHFHNTVVSLTTVEEVEDIANEIDVPATTVFEELLTIEAHDRGALAVEFSDRGVDWVRLHVVVADAGDTVQYDHDGDVTTYWYTANPKDIGTIEQKQWLKSEKLDVECVDAYLYDDEGDMIHQLYEGFSVDECHQDLKAWLEANPLAKGQSIKIHEYNATDTDGQYPIVTTFFQA